MVAFAYPRAQDGPLDLQHYLNVHLPLGVGLTNKLLGIRPKRMTVYSSMEGTGSDSIAAEHAIITTLIFDSKDQADKFLTLFDIEEAATRLTEDYANFTAHHPHPIWGEVVEITDMDPLIARFETEMEA